MIVLTLQLAGVALLAVFIVSIIKSSVRPANFPPGPLSLPLIGYVPFLDVRNMGRGFDKLSKRYGDIFSVFLGKAPCVVLNSYPMIMEAFSMKEFSGRPSIFSGTFFQKGKIGITTTEGTNWELQRNFFHNHMVELVQGKGTLGFQDLILDEVHDLKMDLAKRVGEPLPVSYRFNVSIINILWTIASGRRLHSQQQEFQSVYECIDKITQFMSRAAIMSFIPLLSRIVPERISKMEKGRYHRDRFLNISKKWIREHKEAYRGNRGADLQDAYLAKVEEKAESFSDDGLGALLREMFVVGAETQSTMLRWAVRILSVHKDVQRLVQDEMDELGGRNHDIVWEDRHKLHYTRATIAEVQRFADITPTGIPHKTVCDVDFHGFYLPKGTTVIPNFTACHQSPKYWKKPLDFYPEHFLDDNRKFIDNKEGFLPYGIGTRRCPGEDVANMALFLILANFLNTFSLRIPPGDKREIKTQYEAGTGFIRNPKAYKVILQERE
uniref:Cytochrome P450 CYP3029B2 n=1 Tax=Tigriopus kingsejongensis TaxID=1133412 RepID=A0A2H4FY63_9MAXI|nr:cytochrome P450 CYP3029B2 [Tigriopus kingsejongensis]